MRLVGRYQIEEQIGRGAMANVYRAFDPEIRRSLAIKILNEQYRLDRECVARFIQEARAAGSLAHPNIVTVFDVGEADGIPYIAMELLTGDTLDVALAREGALALPKAIQIASQVASALDYAHGLGIVHRDVKPSNILLCDEGQTAKLLDFGIARVAEFGGGAKDVVMTQVGQVLGTPRYMSPEQARGEMLDGRSDLFSLGGILYEMITGKPAFDGASVATLALQITSQSPRPIATMPECPAGLRFIVDKLLAKAPVKRFATAGQLVEALQREAVALKSERPQATVRRIPLHVQFTAVASLAAALILTVALTWISSQQYKAMERVALSSGLSISGFVAQNAALALMENSAVAPEQADWLPVQAFVNSAARDPNIGELMVIDSLGVVRAAANPNHLGRAPEASGRSIDTGDLAADAHVTREQANGKDVFRFVRPVEYGGHKVGEVVVDLRPDALMSAAAEARNLMMVLGGLILVFTVGLSVIAGRVMLTPLRRLSAALKKASAGDLDFRISHTRRDEVGELFDGFNALAETMQVKPEPAIVIGAKDGVAALRDMAATMVRTSSEPLRDKRA